jgi:hypothetical protein
MAYVYKGLLTFYNAYRPFKGFVSNDDVDRLVDELLPVAQVRIRPDDSVVVVPFREYSTKGLPQKKYHREHYAKLSASLPIDLVKAFSEACRQLNVTQVDVLIPFLEETIRKAGADVERLEDIVAVDGGVL